MRFSLLTACLLSAASAFAADKKKPAENNDLPQPLDPNNMGQQLLMSSPFTRSLNLSDSLVLTGIAYIEGKPVATIFDKREHASYVVTEDPNAKGWKLAEASVKTPLTRSQAKIMIGNEIVIVRYTGEQIKPEDMRKQPSGPGGPPPGGSGDGPPRREYHRPTEEERARFMALSDKAKDKLRQTFSESREKMMNASPEERAAFAKNIFEKIEKDDKAGNIK